jgi:predicted AAA+ superfamily ATPase
MRDCVRTALAWNSIVDDVKAGRLNIDNLQEQQARKELQSAEDVLPRVARECYKSARDPQEALLERCQGRRQCDGLVGGYATLFVPAAA